VFPAFCRYVDNATEREMKCQYVALLSALGATILLLFYAIRYRTVEFRDIPPAAVVRVGLKANCSFDVFRQTAKTTPDGYLRGDGTWKRDSKGQPSRFYPALCDLQYGVDIPSEKARLIFLNVVAPIVFAFFLVHCTGICFLCDLSAYGLALL